MLILKTKTPSTPTPLTHPYLPLRPIKPPRGEHIQCLRHQMLIMACAQISRTWQQRSGGGSKGRSFNHIANPLHEYVNLLKVLQNLVEAEERARKKSRKPGSDRPGGGRTATTHRMAPRWCEGREERGNRGSWF
jgi:hypothetical protein